MGSKGTGTIFGAPFFVLVVFFFSSFARPLDDILFLCAPITRSGLYIHHRGLKKLSAHVPGRSHAVIKKAVVIVWSRLIALWVL